MSHRFDKVLNFFSKPIRYLASYTFILYLLHFPLLQFFSALTFNKETSQTNPTIVMLGTLIVIWSLGRITEKQKTTTNVFLLFFGKVLLINIQ